jgi:hypothetical protein
MDFPQIEQTSFSACTVVCAPQCGHLTVLPAFMAASAAFLTAPSMSPDILTFGFIGTPFFMGFYMAVKIISERGTAPNTYVMHETHPTSDTLGGDGA